jgi:hypothetical protein
MNSVAPDVTWFRLAIRGIGVLLIGLALPSFFSSVVEGVWQIVEIGPMIGADDNWWRLSFALGPVIQVFLGVYLLVGARRLITYCCRGALGMCPACNYDVRNVPGNTCPECGVALPGRSAPSHEAPS